MLSGILALLCLLGVVALIAGVLWAARRFDLPWWATLAIGILLLPVAVSLVFLAGVLTIF